MKFCILALVASLVHAGPEPYLRVTESEDGHSIALEVAIRSFSHVDGPKLHMAAAVHIGEPSFYDAVQAFLDTQDVVLFEGVQPAGMEDEHLEEMSSDERIALTNRRLRLMAGALHRHVDASHELPKTLEAASTTEDRELSTIVKATRLDAWGREVVYEVLPAEDMSPLFDLTSAGPDGEVGTGDDVRFSDQEPLGEAEMTSSEGIQTQLADAMGLVFQLDAMDTTGPRYRNSDMSVEELIEAFGGSGEGDGEADPLFAMLDGSSFSAKLMGGVLKFVGAFKSTRETMKLMLVEMLPRADEMLAVQGGPFEGLMEVLIHDRNEVVLDDIRAIMRDEPDVETLAVIYGAGHLSAIESVLVDEMGFTPTGDQWHRAIVVDVNEMGMTPAQVNMIRSMIRRQLDMQLKMMR